MIEPGTLEQRLLTYGPFPASRRRLVIVSTGNDWEDHGPAMSPASDSLFAHAFCTGAALRTGIRYLGHAPFTSCGSGDCGRHWCPIYLPEPEYFEKTSEYFKVILAACDPRPEAVVIHVPNHGEREMAARIDEFGGRLGVKAKLIGDIVSVEDITPEDYADSPIKELVHEGVSKNLFEHCGLFDYCVAGALGHLDKPRLDALRQEMEADLEATLRKHPVVAHLAGWVRYGGPEIDGLRRVLGVPIAGPYPKVDPKWQNSCIITGRAIVRRTIDRMVTEVLTFVEKLFGE
jgi:hypothetical protein